MSLISGIASGNGFVCVTGDLRSIRYDDTGNVYTVSNENRKVLRLTDRVLYANAGIMEINDEVERRLIEMVDPDDDLEACCSKLKEVMMELINDENYEYNIDLKEESNQSYVILAGYYKDGRVGIESYAAGDGMVFDDDRMIVDNIYGFNTAYPGPKQAEEKHLQSITSTFFITIDEMKSLTPSQAHARLIKYHKTGVEISPERISPNFDIYTLYRDDGDKIRFEHRYFDLSPLLKQRGA